MGNSIDWYEQTIIHKGDAGSDILRILSVSTLRNCKNVEIIGNFSNQFPVLRIPEDHLALVYSTCGDPKELDVVKHASYLVDRLVKNCLAFCKEAVPLGFANIIDSSTGDIELLKKIMNSLVERANHYGIAILNGENAIMGSRITKNANVSGTIICMIPRIQLEINSNERIFTLNGNIYAVFDPEGRAVYINSDGVGTKTELYERKGNYEYAVDDFAAMNIDDASKKGANVRVLSGVVETKGNIPLEKIKLRAKFIGDKIGFNVILQSEDVGDRISGYTKDSDAYHINGSVVSTIDEDRLMNSLIPKPGDKLIAICGSPNPRSNGITDKRSSIIKLLGEDWHKTKEGVIFLEYLAEPSTILYGVFEELIKKGLATGVFHMSGGAYNGKLARPIASNNLFVRIENLFPPDWRELALAGVKFTPSEVAYAKWPMGNDGFAATGDPLKVIEIIENAGLKARIVGTIEEAKDNKTGVELKEVIASNGKPVYFSGK